MPSNARWTAPGRVNLIGEHTDYNDGYVLPFALPLGVTATVEPRSDDLLTVTSTGWPDERVSVPLSSFTADDLPGWATYAAGAVWTLRDAGYAVGGIDLALDANLPVGAGLSSSAAVECSVTGALGDAFGLGLGPAELVRLAHRAETEFAGVPVGVLDQSAVVRCTRAHALFLDVRSGEARQIPLALDNAGLVILVIDTRAEHRLVDGEYAKRRSQCAESAAVLGVPALRDVTPAGLDDALARLPDDVLRRRTRHVVTENARVLDTVALLDRGADPREIGPLLTASHVSLRDDFEVSSRELDVAVDAVLAAGAYGARMTGGGFGGSAIALVDARSDDVGIAVRHAFAAAGLREPNVFAVTPAAGAHPA